MTPLKSPPLDDPTLALIRMAVHEDVGGGDKTVELSIPPKLTAQGRIVARAPGTIAGTYLLPAILAEYAGSGPPISCVVVAGDGTAVKRDQVVAEFAGPAPALLSAERVLLNFLSHLSGIATLTRRFVDAVAPVAGLTGKPVICDTRKTTPGYRTLDKYAVRCGGGVNLRMGLYDGVMLKDNHLAALREKLGAMTLADLAANVRASLDPKIGLWLEVDTLAQLADALGGSAAGADIILLDNFTSEQMRQAVTLRDQASKKSKILLEASGGITLENVLAVAQTGVDRISIGALTHSAPILDLSMEFIA